MNTAEARQHRGVVVAKKGIVAASQPLAVSAGLHTLQRGGSFADAAIATSAVLCVTEPYASHLGGDAFLIVYENASGKTTALNGSGAAPRAATPERFSGRLSTRGLAAASVPGLVAMWGEIHTQWGRLPLAELLAPAIEYAEHGFPAGYRYCRSFGMNEALLRSFPSTQAALLPTGPLPTPGSIVRQPDLAWTLRQIAEAGPDTFYTGSVAERLLAFSRHNGGLFVAEDFASHRTQITDPIRTDYRGYTVHGQPPVSQGHILLQMLNLVEGFDLAAMEPNSADTLHVQAEANKLAFADRHTYLGDPSFVDVPLDVLLSKEYAAERRSLIRLERAMPSAPAGEIAHDTTYFCIGDRDGNAVSFIQSVFWGFGSGVVAEGTGVLFNNRLSGFSLDPASPNLLAPGKRTAHTLNAYLVTKEGDRRTQEESRALSSSFSPHPSSLAFVGGTPGGDFQVQSNLQVICNAIDFEMNPQEAVEAPRWQHGDSVGAGEAEAETLYVEERVSEAVREELARRGHRVEAIGPWAHGSSYQFFSVHPETGAYLAGSDPRCDGHAAGI